MKPKWMGCKMIRWLFFDVGNVILNDDPAMAYFYHEIYQAIQQNGEKLTLDDLLAAREQSILVERNGNHYDAVGQQFLERRVWQKLDRRIRHTLAEKWAKFSPLMPDVVPIIETLSSQFNLGLIANQPREVKGILENLGLLKYFQVHGISQIVGLSKPDPAFFHWALDQARCESGEAVMIGDRIDNDIRPAKSVGMKTLWVKLPLSKKDYTPSTEFEQRYFKSLARASASHLPPQEEAEMPDAVAEDFESILVEIDRLNDNRF